MLAKVDDHPVAPEALWWPAMNFNQFRWNGSIGRYELVLPRADFVERLSAAHAQCMRDLQKDDRIAADPEPSPLRDVGYPSLNQVLNNAEARFELIEVFLYRDVFESFLPHLPSRAASFMINSVEDVAASPDSVVIRGRGYHGGPGFSEPQPRGGQ